MVLAASYLLHLVQSSTKILQDNHQTLHTLYAFVNFYK